MIDTILGERIEPVDIVQLYGLIEKGDAILQRAFPDEGDRRACLVIQVRQLSYLEMKALGRDV